LVQATLYYIGTQLPSPKRAQPPIFSPFYCGQTAGCIKMPLLGRPRPRRLSVRWGPSPLPKKRRSPPIFGPRLLWPNGCMDQDATWYGGRPRPRRLCVRWKASYPQKKGTPPHAIFGPYLLWPRSTMSATAELLLCNQSTRNHEHKNRDREKIDVKDRQKLQNYTGVRLNY